MYTKGADNIVIPRMNIDKAMKEKLNSDLSVFARKGLRTLVMGKKDLTDSFYEKWVKDFDKINTSGDVDKESQLNVLYNDLEWDFDYIGCSAIEDLLQDEVPETIKTLMEANIRLWVLTGDKQETAIEIGKSCNLINESTMDLIILSSETEDELISKLKFYLNYEQVKSKLAIVIDGFTLAIIFENEVLMKAFFNFGLKANSVICCRVSPK